MNDTTSDKIDGMLDFNGMTSISGLAFMQGVRDGTLPPAPIADTLNFTLYLVEEGRIIFRGTPGIESMNPMRTLHGGWYGTILDSAMACAVMTKVPTGSYYTTLEYKVNIIRPIPPGMTVDCIGDVQHAGRSTGVAEGRIVGVDDGKLYATGSTTCMIMKAP
jgi:uncharacterized protein (TIGR00369 family)